MAAHAYVLLNVEPAVTDNVIKQLRAIPGAFIREVLGPYDVVVELEKDTAVDITAVVRTKIRSIRGVTSTTTCMWFEGAYGLEAGGK